MVDRVDLVDAGANHDLSSGEGSHVSLFKRADPTAKQSLDCPNCDEGLSLMWSDGGSQMPNYCPNCGAKITMSASGGETMKAAGRGAGVKTMSNETTKAGAWERFKALIKAAGTNVTDEQIAAVEKEIPLEAAASAPAAPAKKEDTPVADTTKNAPAPTDMQGLIAAEVAKAVAAEREKLSKAADDRVAKAEADAKAAREQAQALADAAELAKRQVEAGSFRNLPIKAAEDGAMLKALFEKAPDQAKRVVELLKAADEGLRVNRAFMLTGGGDEATVATFKGAPGSAYEEMVAKANEMVDAVRKQAGAKPLTFEQAMVDVATRYPELAKRYHDEKLTEIKRGSAQ